MPPRLVALELGAGGAVVGERRRVVAQQEGVVGKLPQLLESANGLIRQLKGSERTSLLSVLFEGPAGAGKTALAASIALQSEFPFVKLISPESFVGISEAGKAMAIARVFDDAHKSPLSLVVLDDLERLLEYVT